MKSRRSHDHDVEAVVASLQRLGSKRTRDGMARFAIPSHYAFGVPMGAVQKMAKRLGRSHELAAGDERNFVKKGVSWALRGIGRRSVKLNAAAARVARRLAASRQAAARWVGKDALRELTSRAVVRRLAARLGARG